MARWRARGGLRSRRTPQGVARAARRWRGRTGATHRQPPRPCGRTGERRRRRSAGGAAAGGPARAGQRPRRDPRRSGIRPGGPAAGGRGGRSRLSRDGSDARLPGLGVRHGPPGTRVIVVDDASRSRRSSPRSTRSSARSASACCGSRHNRGFPASANAGLAAALRLPRPPRRGAAEQRHAAAAAAGSRGFAPPCTPRPMSAPRRRCRTMRPSSAIPTPTEANPAPDLPRPAGSRALAAEANPAWRGDPDRDRLLHVHPPRMPGRRRAVPRGPVRPGLRRGERFLHPRPASGLASSRRARSVRGACRRTIVRRGARAPDRTQSRGAGAAASRLSPADRAIFRPPTRWPAARRRLDAARWRGGRSRQGAVLMVTHDGGGGVEQAVQARCAALRARRDAADPAAARCWPAMPIRTRRRPIAPASAWWARRSGGFPNLRFSVPAELPALARLLRGDGVDGDPGASPARPQPRGGAPGGAARRSHRAARA